MRRPLAVAVVLALMAPALLAGPWKLKLEPNHSTISFSVPIVGGMTTVRGSFHEFQVDIVYDADDIERNSVITTINAAPMIVTTIRRNRLTRAFSASRSDSI